MPETRQFLSTRPIRLLPESAEPADRQLAASVAQLAGLAEQGRPSLRWYRFDPPALLLGSSQRPEVADLAACAAAGARPHRRRSGGGAVLGDDSLLLLDLALPPRDPLYTYDVTESYRWLAEVWAAALRELGLDARVLPVAEARADAQALDPLLKSVCYGGLSPYEVTVGGRKLVGLAQVRRQSGALIQAGVYLRWSPERTAALMAGTPAERARLAELLDRRVAGLNAPRASVQLGAEQVQVAVHRQLDRMAGFALSPEGWSAAELAARDEALARFAALG